MENEGLASIVTHSTSCIKDASKITAKMAWEMSKDSLEDVFCPETLRGRRFLTEDSRSETFFVN